MSGDSPVIDLRQYTVVPGQRDTLIDLFDRYFVDGQEQVGIHVVGQFRDLDAPDRFVWLRSFESMPARGEALARFYYGPVWREHRDAANATMIDSDDALLLEPISLGYGYPTLGGTRDAGPRNSLVEITVACFDRPLTQADRDLVGVIRDELERAGADVVAMLTTHLAENNFPVLALRDEHVLVWIVRLADDAAHVRLHEMLTQSRGWNETLRRLSGRCTRLPMQRLRLRPTRNSQLH